MTLNLAICYFVTVKWLLPTLIKSMPRFLKSIIFDIWQKVYRYHFGVIEFDVSENGTFR